MTTHIHTCAHLTNQLQFRGHISALATDTSSEASTSGMARRIRPNKAERAKLKALTGRTNLYESDQLALIRTEDGTKYDPTTETERENWFVTAKLTHRTKYGWHYQRRMMNRVKDQHPSGCHITYK